MRPSRASPVELAYEVRIIKLGCLAKTGDEMNALNTPLAITTNGQLKLTVSDMRVLGATVPEYQCGVP